MACASHFLINDDIKIVRTQKNMAASVVNLRDDTATPRNVLIAVYVR